MKASKDGLRLKATMFSADGGLTWLVVNQFYLEDISTRGFLDESFQGVVLVQKERPGDESRILPVPEKRGRP